MPTRHLSLREHSDRYLQASVTAGRFSSADEAVETALNLLQRREKDKAKLAWLKSAAQEGMDAIDRGDYTTLSSPEEIHEFMRSLTEEVLKEKLPGFAVEPAVAAAARSAFLFSDLQLAAE